MHVVQILLPTHDNDRRLFDDRTPGTTHAEPAAQFGGRASQPRPRMTAAAPGIAAAFRIA